MFDPLFAHKTFNGAVTCPEIVSFFGTNNILATYYVRVSIALFMDSLTTLTVYLLLLIISANVLTFFIHILILNGTGIPLFLVFDNGSFLILFFFLYTLDGFYPLIFMNIWINE